MKELVVCQLDNWQHIIVIISVAITEYWLGKTNKTKAGSMIELVINIVESIVKRLLKRGQDGNENSNSNGN